MCGSCGLYSSEPDLASLLFSWTRIGFPFSCGWDAPCCSGLRSGFWWHRLHSVRPSRVGKFEPHRLKPVPPVKPMSTVQISAPLPLSSHGKPVDSFPQAGELENELKQ